ncbi:MAG: NADH:ubiquinone reductase (Na(+)-transporting) subunit B [Chlamydiia bacterium]|nr:NADH:ubiquinone reductase (Na(+)-transporting) subunit B [Chlamydiia bacterium]
MLDYQLSFVEKGKPLHKLRPLLSAADTFCYEPAHAASSKGPHIKDAVDLKRWMTIVVIALIPCILFAMWNTGLQKLVFGSGNYHLMEEYLASAGSLSGYMDFVIKDTRWLTIIGYGAMAFLPVMLISYAVGGLCEGFFACYRGHEIAEGFLVTGMLYPLVLPPTIPYWMVAVGVAAGVVIVKELFGGTGQNILNPALACRAFLFFTFPNKMSGDVWVGTNPTTIRESLSKMNSDAALAGVDAYSQATPLAIFNISDDVKRVHSDAIAANTMGADSVGTQPVIQQQFEQWSHVKQQTAQLGELSATQLQDFITSPLAEGGLALPPENYQAAHHFASLNYGLGFENDFNFLLGNKLGCFGETSVIAILIGAFILIYTGVGSWRTMAGTLIGALGTALLFQLGATFLGVDGGAWNPAKYAFPAYKHLLIGGFAFGLVFMTTDPVTHPALNSAKWLFGLLVGACVIVIRAINPAYPEGMMLAILIGNVFAPLIEYYAVRNYRRARRVAS